MQRRNIYEYTVGWICAITTEYMAAQSLLDELHEGPEFTVENDNNDYTLGTMRDHNVVIAVLPYGDYGLSTAAVVETHIVFKFCSTNEILCVMIC